MKDTRKQRGRWIGRNLNVRPTSGGWYVPSERGSQLYFVRKIDSGPICSCEDFELRRTDCKHIEAVRVREKSLFPEPPLKLRPTYPQKWNSYNNAQTNEKTLIPAFLSELCDLVVPEEDAQRTGRPRIPLRDALFSCALKVESNLSTRRFMALLQDAKDRGYVSRVPSYNHVIQTFSRNDITPIIEKLIAVSCVPLKALERDMIAAVDSTGYGLRSHHRHFSERKARMEDRKEFVKLHALVGVRTHVIAAAHVTSSRVHDSKEFKPLLDFASNVFSMKEVCADKAYLTGAAVNAAAAVGASPYIAIKRNTREREGLNAWNTMYHAFMLNQEEWLSHYHKRSNVETVFSSMKALYAPFLRNRSFVTQTNELLFKVLCHNLGRVVHAAYEHGFDPVFSDKARKGPAGNGMNGLRLVPPMA